MVDECVGLPTFLSHKLTNYSVSIVFTRIPKFEMLTTPEKELYDYDKAEFNASARAAIDSLYFAKAGKTGETWVPLVEKAFAKLNGDYASVMYGRTCDALEDITGYVRQILD